MPAIRSTERIVAAVYVTPRAHVEANKALRDSQSRQWALDQTPRQRFLGISTTHHLKRLHWESLEFFLTQSPQSVHIQKKTPPIVITLSFGCPQGSVLSPLLFTLRNARLCIRIRRTLNRAGGLVAEPPVTI